jgi:hypothetical protein
LMNLTVSGHLYELVRTCETVCVAGCCGLDAFDLDSHQIVPWLREHGLTEGWKALDELSDMIARVRESQHAVSNSEEFNARWDDPAECAAYLTKWFRVVRWAVEEVAGRSIRIEPTWRTEAVIGLAMGAALDADFGRLPVLADALEDAGCNHPDILGHCRDNISHDRGCWVTSLLLDSSFSE